MYTRLTKTVTVKERECVACVYHGTKMCRIHKGIPDCSHCEVFAAILNQLHAFENIIYEEHQDIEAEK